MCTTTWPASASRTISETVPNKTFKSLITYQSQAPLFWALSAPGTTRGDSFMAIQIYWLFKKQLAAYFCEPSAIFGFPVTYHMKQVEITVATADHVQKWLFLGWGKEDQLYDVLFFPTIKMIICIWQRVSSIKYEKSDLGTYGRNKL